MRSKHCFITFTAGPIADDRPHGNYLNMDSESIFSEKLNRGVSKPGGFPLFFGKGPDCVADTFGTVPRRCS